MQADGRGVLYPGRLPDFHREPAPPELAETVRWFWVPCWDLPPGVSSRQEVLPFPAANLVVEPEGVRLYGPTTGVSVRVLEGRGWAVGALLLPAGLGRMHGAPGELRDASVEVDAPGLHRAVVAAMGGGDAAGRAEDGHREAGRSAAVRALEEWLGEEMLPLDAEGLVANAMVELIASTRELVRVEQLAERMGMSVRGVQRLAARWIGLPPLAVIRRYRLQEAALRLREDPGLSVVRVAADLGYADQAHLAADFRAVVGLAPSRYRRGQVSWD
ncbi:AraC family transcriptional regulator [Actinomyces bowdenii]|nr:AraC family transcriptional regulator [Actinomyces bowdenii]